MEQREKEERQRVLRNQLSVIDNEMGMLSVSRKKLQDRISMMELNKRITKKKIDLLQIELDNSLREAKKIEQELFQIQSQELDYKKKKLNIIVEVMGKVMVIA